MLRQGTRQQEIFRRRALRTIKKITSAEKFTTTKRIKFGVRYYIALGQTRRGQAVFKIAVKPPSYDHLTNEKFSREILFLTFVQGSQLQHLKKAIPQVYAWDTTGRSWYLRQYLRGIMQNINGGNVRYKKSFFNARNLHWLFLTIKQLHSIQSGGLPKKFRKLLYRPQSLEYLWRFISPYCKTVERFTGIRGVCAQIKSIFNANAKIYNSSRRVLAHQEMYAPHILDVQGTSKLIDWENIGWASILKDVVTVWMRASEHPTWQHQLYLLFRRHYRSFPGFDRLWMVTTLLQSVFNVIGYDFYPDRNDFRELANFSKKNIVSILNNTFKP